MAVDLLKLTDKGHCSKTRHGKKHFPKIVSIPKASSAGRARTVSCQDNADETAFWQAGSVPANKAKNAGQVS
jgi:hypothetical protein